MKQLWHGLPCFDNLRRQGLRYIPELWKLTILMMGGSSGGALTVRSHTLCCVLDILALLLCDVPSS
jgi:hypothetical protein